MKKKYILLSIVIAIFGLSFGCHDAEYEIKNNSIYIAEAATAAKSVTVSMENNGADINLTVRLAIPTANDVQVEISTDPNILETFNATNSTEYVMLPADCFKLPENAKVTIPAGEIGTTVKIHVDNFDTQGKRYALPVVLGNVVEGDVEKSIAQSKFIYLIAKPLVVSVPVMKGVNGGILVDAATSRRPFGINVAQWSLECWTRMSAYSKNNQAIFNLGSKDHEIYIRFGDANSPYNYLQIKTLGGQVQTARDLVGGVWYHWAFVYDGVTLHIYRNGELDVKFDPPAPAGGQVRIDFVEMISSGATYFPDLCAMSQVRLWKTAISSTQIKNNMYYAVDPSNPNLIAYWPMNEGSGSNFADITGNNYDAVAGSGILQKWEDNIRFDK
ncbi:MAG: DUF1735 and LamG domain-containing protein [Prevotellaceae bacterium]|jgi:hypothetical protein|nr:DUF1735 and LamG domain-containing protein [Prevotellaceae bacterium]